MVRRLAIALATITLGVAGRAAAPPAIFTLIGKSTASYASQANFPATSPELRPDRHDNSYRSPAVGTYHILLLAGPRQDMMSFRVGQLTNPAIRLPAGSRLTLNVVNVDDDMVHDLDITAQPPPYPQAAPASPMGTAVLRPYKGKGYSSATLILKAQHAGTVYYFCSVPGHARHGMWGKIVVTP
ncbi:MAG: sulfocyanin-like copper-binding protein [Terriglobales bacterium]